MAVIDRFIKPIGKVGATSLIIASGEKVSLIVKGDACPLTPEPITHEMVAAYLGEILPPGLAAASARKENLEFPYMSPYGGVSVKVSHDGGGHRMVLTPVAAAQPAAATQPAAAKPG